MSKPFFSFMTFIKAYFQRGFMDPLDKILSVIVMNAVVIVSQDTEIQDDTIRRWLEDKINTYW